jgi:hypothetical protein
LCMQHSCPTKKQYLGVWCEDWVFGVPESTVNNVKQTSSAIGKQQPIFEIFICKISARKNILKEPKVSKSAYDVILRILNFIKKKKKKQFLVS